MKEFIAMVLCHQNSAWWLIGVGVGVEGRKQDMYKMFHCKSSLLLDPYEGWVGRVMPMYTVHAVVY